MRPHGLRCGLSSVTSSPCGPSSSTTSRSAPGSTTQPSPPWTCSTCEWNQDTEAPPTLPVSHPFLSFLFSPPYSLFFPPLSPPLLPCPPSLRMNTVVLHEQLFADHFFMTPAARFSLGQSLRCALITPLIDRFTLSQETGNMLRGENRHHQQPSRPSSVTLLLPFLSLPSSPSSRG